MFLFNLLILSIDAYLVRFVFKILSFMLILLKKNIVKRKDSNINPNSNGKCHPHNFQILSDFISISNITLALMLLY